MLAWCRNGIGSVPSLLSKLSGRTLTRNQLLQGAAGPSRDKEKPWHLKKMVITNGLKNTTLQDWIEPSRAWPHERLFHWFSAHAIQGQKGHICSSLLCLHLSLPLLGLLFRFGLGGGLALVVGSFVLRHITKSQLWQNKAVGVPVRSSQVFEVLLPPLDHLLKPLSRMFILCRNKGHKLLLWIKIKQTPYQKERKIKLQKHHLQKLQKTSANTSEGPV